MNKKENIYILFILLLNLAYFRFFRPIGVGEITLKLVYYSLLGISILFSIKNFLNGAFTRYGGLLRWLVFSILFSIIAAYISWNQRLDLTFISSLPFLSFLFFFFLWEQNIDIDSVEKIIWIFCIVFLICYFYALFRAPIRVFTGYGELGKEISTSRGLSRIRLTVIGGGPLFLAYFFALSKYKVTKYKKWIGISLFLFVVIVMQLGRQAIFYSFVLSIYFLLNNIKWKKKIILLIGSTILTWFVVFHNPIINKLVNNTYDQYQKQFENSKEDIRISAYKFYLFRVSPNLFSVMFGNGIYSLGKSNYGNFIDRYGRNYGYIPADVGYAAIYLFYGLFGLLIFLFILIRVLKQKVPERYAYAKIYMLFLMLGSITGNTLLGSIPTLCMALYILDYIDYNRINSDY